MNPYHIYNSMMEEYETKRQYLRHLKKMGEIREGMGKLPVFPISPNITLSRTKTRDFMGSSGRGSQIHSLGDCKQHTSTQRIMRDFTIEKENTRLVTKILNMNSSITLRKYEQEYQNSKKYLLRPQKAKQISFKFFDIRFAHTAASPQDYFHIYMQLAGKKVLLANDSLFQLRKKELKFRRNNEVVLRVQGKNDWGIVKIKDEQSLLDIRRHGQKVGSVVIELASK